MTDDPKKQKQDRKLVAAKQGYETREFAAKFGLAQDEAALIIKRYGPSRAKLEAHMASRNA
jgi:hypothetical protein